MSEMDDRIELKAKKEEIKKIIEDISDPNQLHALESFLKGMTDSREGTGEEFEDDLDEDQKRMLEEFKDDLFSDENTPSGPKKEQQ